MSAEQAAPVRSSVAVEDVMLCVLGLIAGPLLWWMSRTWQQLPAASSVQTLEYWIALICGFIGLALSALWFIFVLSGLVLILGLKTRNAWITYWAEVFTPSFLRRLIISLVGVQVALTSQAFAAPSEDQTSEADEIQQHEPFMPYIQDPAPLPTDGADPTESPTSAEPSADTATHSPHPSERLTATDEPSPSAKKDMTSPVVEPRQHSEEIVTPKPTASSSAPDVTVATPRETSIVEIEAQTEPEMQTPMKQPQRPGNFLPQQPLPSPYITTPNQSRSTEDPTVVVKSGDCLWDIAHHELGAEATLFQIDQRWRQWWEHNRTIIGDDPHALAPGTVLLSPPFND